MTDTDSVGTPATATATSSTRSPRRVVDRALYALFGRHADRSRHDVDRKRYRGTDVAAGFDVYLARVYALSWVTCGLAFAAAFGLGLSVPDRTVAEVVRFLHAGVPILDRVALPRLPRLHAAAGAAALAAVAGKRATVRAGGLYLRWAADARRSGIERTLPGAVRYLRALATGSDDKRAMLRKVADNEDAYGETAVAVRKALNKAALTGNLGEGLRMVARDTPSRHVLAPFLLKFREHADQGADALEGYLRLESRMLSHRQARNRERAEGFLELVAELFVVLLVLPALFVIVVTVLSVLTPGLGAPVSTPVGTTTVRALVVYGCAAFVLAVGAAAAGIVGSLRPPDQSTATHGRPAGVPAVVRTAAINPASAAVVAVPLSLPVAGLLWELGYRPANVVLLGYVAFAVPVGAVAVRRSRLDDAKDREIRDFVHAVAGHVNLGRPFGAAVEHVARDVDLGALDPHVADLAFDANLTTRSGDLRAAALSRFVDRVGTPLAEQTMGLVTGALDAGSDAEDVFETLQTEVGRLYHEKKALRASMQVYVAVGWTTALLVVGIVVAVNVSVLDGFAQLSAVPGTASGLSLDPAAVRPERDRRRFYVVTQATMLACGWFAGTASRGRYAALLHSGLLVAAAYFVFAGATMI